MVHLVLKWILVRLVITEMVVTLLKLGLSNTEVDFLLVGSSASIQSFNFSHLFSHSTFQICSITQLITSIQAQLFTSI